MKTIELICINYGSFDDAFKITKHCLNILPKLSRATILHPEKQSIITYPSGAIFYPDTLDDINIIYSKSLSQHICCLKEMPPYLMCDYALSIQWDGFIIRPDLWDDRFLDYDYIGCPWPLQNIVNPKHRVGSGGFCLFSKRLAQYWAIHGDPEIPNDWERGAVNRKKYEDAGFTFAPLELSAKFGKEHDLEDMDIKEGETFGFHDFRINKEHRYKYRKEVYA